MGKYSQGTWLNTTICFDEIGVIPLEVEYLLRCLVTLFPYRELNEKQTVRVFGLKRVLKVANVCLYVLTIILMKATWKASLISAPHLVTCATVALMFGSLAISIFPALIGKKIVSSLIATTPN